MRENICIKEDIDGNKKYNKKSKGLINRKAVILEEELDKLDERNEDVIKRIMERHNDGKRQMGNNHLRIL